jgi:N-acetylated-alpha-linked acidic dipeptidase
MVLRIANADVLPTTTSSSRGRCGGICRRSTSPSRIITGTFQRLRFVGDRSPERGQSFATVRDSVLAAAPNRAVEHANQALMRVERALTRPEGLRTRPWFRSLVYVADENNGYANMPLPSVNEAIRANDARLTTTEVEDLTARFEGAAQAVADARDALRSR